MAVATAVPTAVGTAVATAVGTVVGTAVASAVATAVARFKYAFVEGGKNIIIRCYGEFCENKFGPSATKKFPDTILHCRKIVRAQQPY